MTDDKTCYHYWQHVLLFHLVRYLPQAIESVLSTQTSNDVLL